MLSVDMTEYFSNDVSTSLLFLKIPKYQQQKIIIISNNSNLIIFQFMCLGKSMSWFITLEPF